MFDAKSLLTSSTGNLPTVHGSELFVAVNNDKMGQDVQVSSWAQPLVKKSVTTKLWYKNCTYQMKQVGVTHFSTKTPLNVDTPSSLKSSSQSTSLTLLLL